MRAPGFVLGAGIVGVRATRRLKRAAQMLTVWSLMASCGDEGVLFDPHAPARGPSEHLPNTSPKALEFRGGEEPVPAPLETADGLPLSSCDASCQSYCDAQPLSNPMNVGLCSSLWGLGLSGTAVAPEEACRRLFADTLGRLPSHSEVTEECLGKPWNEVVLKVLSSRDFVRTNRRLWADRLQYDTEAISVERIYDADLVVQSMYEGRIAYDQFAAIMSAHPVLTRRHDTEGDRAEALMWTFLGRPPFGNERADLGRLYHLWHNGYYDHPLLGTRLPDSYIRYDCLDEQLESDSKNAGECTSTAFGFEQLVLTPDTRSFLDGDRLLMWGGFLSAREWNKLQAPGRLLAQQWSFWEHAVNSVIEQYLGYALTAHVPEIGERLTRYLLDHDGDIRALHYAVLTSYSYMQSAAGTQQAPSPHMHGPLKQAEAEVWVDSLSALVGSSQSRCDLRLNRPREFLRAGSPYGIALVRDSDWDLNGDMTNVKSDYRDLVRALGGCPDNSQGGRFKITSVLTTANQLDFAGRLCDPSDEGTRGRASTKRLLPNGVDASDATTEDVASRIFEHQTRLFLARTATDEELERARVHGAACALEQCSAEEFARPVCFALLSSAEMLFY